MLTVALALLAFLLAVAVGVVGRFWWEAARTAAEQAQLLRTQQGQIDNLTADLDALSLSGPAVDTRTGSHDRLPIQPDIRQMLTDYCEGMWQHTQEDTK